MTNPLPPLPINKDRVAERIRGAIFDAKRARFEGGYERSPAIDRSLKKALKHLKRALGEAEALESEDT